MIARLACSDRPSVVYRTTKRALTMFFVKETAKLDGCLILLESED